MRKKKPGIALVNSNLIQTDVPLSSHPEDFMGALANQIAERCTQILIGKLPKPNVIQPRYMTVEQAAVYVGCKKRSFEYLIKKKLFPVIRRDRLVLIDKEDLDKFMTRQKC